MKFRKKPIVIEAVQFTREMWEGKAEWPDGVIRGYIALADRGGPVIDTLEDRMEVEVGDWIITGVKGERYLCKPDVFEMTYEPA